MSVFIRVLFFRMHQVVHEVGDEEVRAWEARMDAKKADLWPFPLLIRIGALDGSWLMAVCEKVAEAGYIKAHGSLTVDRNERGYKPGTTDRDVVHCEHYFDVTEFAPVDADGTVGETYRVAPLLVNRIFLVLL